jgi:hypothetical protein
LPGGQSTQSQKVTLAERYGASVCRDGYTALPNSVLRHYARLGISESELVFLQQLWTYWWNTALPYPSVATIAARMGKSVRQIQHYIARLRHAGWLVIVERRDPQGGQMSNAYDLRPFLAAVARLVEAEDGQSDRVQLTAPAGVQLAAPNVDPPEQHIVSISISTPQALAGADTGVIHGPEPRLHPPAPTLQTASQATDAPVATAGKHEPEHGELRQAMEQLGAVLGDLSPRSSLTRVLRLQSQVHLDEQAFVQQLKAVGARVRPILPAMRCHDQAGRPNGMPYFFASLEAALAPPPRFRQTRRRCPANAPRPHATLPAALATPPARDPIDSGIRAWDLVRSALRESLAPAVYTQHVQPLQARLDSDGVLVLQTQSVFARAWVESRLRSRMEEILAQSSHPGQLRVEVAATG